MGITGLIFGAVAAMWLAYLVPWYLSHRDQRISDDADPTITFARDVKIVRAGAIEVESDDESDAAVSTPLIRAARRRDAVLMARRAARTRRRVLVVCLLTLVGLTVATVLRFTPWWSALAGLGLLVGWLLVSRLSSVRMYRRIDDALAGLDMGDDEHTVVVQLEQPGMPAEAEGEHEHSVALSEPIETSAASLWDPIPVAAHTYVSRPATARTVRTIDLTAPEPPRRPAPVTAEETDGDASDVIG